MPVATVSDLVRQGRREALSGRDEELRLLSTAAAPEGPIIAYGHGPAGIGKTTLISALEARLQAHEVRRLHISAGAVEPTRTAIVAALAKAVDGEAAEVAELAKAFARAAGITAVIIDDFDAWRLAAAWIRTDLLPALPASARLVLVGTARPPPAWSTEYGPCFLDLKLGALPRTAGNRS